MSARPFFVAESSERPLRRLPLLARARLIGPFFSMWILVRHLSAQANVPVCENSRHGLLQIPQCPPAEAKLSIGVAGIGAFPFLQLGELFKLSPMYGQRDLDGDGDGPWGRGSWNIVRCISLHNVAGLGRHRMSASELPFPFLRCCHKS